MDAIKNRMKMVQVFQFYHVAGDRYPDVQQSYDFQRFFSVKEKTRKFVLIEQQNRELTRLIFIFVVIAAPTRICR